MLVDDSMFMEKDRKYFEDHPSATEYIRPYIEGELMLPNHFPLVSGICDIPMVKVIQIASGIRARQFLFDWAEVIERRSE